MFQSPFFCDKPENPIDGLCDHHFFIGANDANRGPAGVRRDYTLRPRISRLIQLDAEELQSTADVRADRRRVLADASGENQSIEPAKHSHISAEPLFRLIAEE